MVRVLNWSSVADAPLSDEKALVFLSKRCGLFVPDGVPGGLRAQLELLYIRDGMIAFQLVEDARVGYHGAADVLFFHLHDPARPVIAVEHSHRTDAGWRKCTRPIILGWCTPHAFVQHVEDSTEPRRALLEAQRTK